MSYTTVEQVRQHLIIPYPIEEQVVDQPVTLTGSDYVRFFGGGVDNTSVRVKAVRSHVPVRTSIVFTEGSVLVSTSMIVPDSVVVASDSSLGTVYVENVDYIVDYGLGRVSIKAGGCLTSTQQVVVWYLPYALYEAGHDYTLDASGGQIKRLPGGSIASGEMVRLDYRPVFVSVTDEIIENAVALANGMVQTEVDTEREFDANPNLSAAATYRALEVVCRASASRELASQSGADKIATVWIKLADDYSTRSDQLLTAFRPPFTGPRNPQRS
jgi:hypothetical protein